MNQQDVLDGFYELFGSHFKELGFLPNKKKDIYTKKGKSSREIFDLHCVPGAISFCMHTRLKFIDVETEKIFKRVDNLVRTKIGLKKITSSRITIDVTDWKNLLRSQGRENSGVWFWSFDDVEEVKMRMDDYIELINAGSYWLNEKNNLEKLKQSLLDEQQFVYDEIYLTLTKVYESRELASAYQFIRGRRSELKGYYDDRQIELFYEELKSA